MDKASVLAILKRFREVLGTKGIGVSKLILFGSYSRGVGTEGSDIDVVVVSNDFAGKGYWERIDILSNAIYELFEPIEAVAMTEEEWENGDSLLVQVARQGEVV